MRHEPIEKIAENARLWRTAEVVPPAEAWWTTRRRRLRRLADVLETRREPLRLFSDMECFPKKDQLRLRRPGSPLALAFAQIEFRREGLAGDSVANAMDFFLLSLEETHRLFCDCRYAEAIGRGAASGSCVADRVRALAEKKTTTEIWLNAKVAITAVARWLTSRSA